MPPSKKTYSTKCSYPNCDVKYSQKGLSFHQLPKNATEEQKEKWAQVLPNVLENPQLRYFTKLAKNNF